ncbi:MAG: hypothetical protein WBM15_04775 [Chromatiaceae bacterium]
MSALDLTGFDRAAAQTRTMTITSVVTALGKWNPGLEGLDWVVALGVDSDMIPCRGCIWLGEAQAATH